jgi:hypothetical protein
MSTPASLITQDEIEALAGRLDGWDGLSDREREVLGGVFALAGVAVTMAADEPEAEVEGFGISPDLPRPDTSFGAFQQGATVGAGGANTDFLTFRFKLVAVKTISWSHD